MEEEIINSYLTFTVDGGLYGVHVSRVVELQAYENTEAKREVWPQASEPE